MADLPGYVYVRPAQGRAHLLRSPGAEATTLCGRNASTWARVPPCPEACRICLGAQAEGQKYQVFASRPHRTWRRRFAPLIAAVLADTCGEPPLVIRRRLLALWQDLHMGDRRGWPYKVYRSEVRRQQREGPSPSLAEARARRRQAREMRAAEGPTLALPFEE